MSTQIGFDYWAPISKADLCRCCRRRRREDGFTMCEKCTTACYGEGGIKEVSLEFGWHRRVSSSMSGLRQRAKALHQPLVATMSEVAGLIKAQDYRCALSGVVLQPDKSSELGHRIPASDGGQFKIDNLFWITRDINRMMGKGDEAGFVEMCRKVTEQSNRCPPVGRFFMRNLSARCVAP